MAAELTSRRVNGRVQHRAWCEEHQDGRNGTQAQAEKWADGHNAARHLSTDGENLVDKATAG